MLALGPDADAALGPDVRPYAEQRGPGGRPTSGRTVTRSRRLYATSTASSSVKRSPFPRRSVFHPARSSTVTSRRCQASQPVYG